MEHWYTEPNNFLRRPMKWSSSIGGLNAAASPQGLATQ